MMPSSLTLAGQEAVGRSPRDSIASRLLDTAGTSLAHRHKRPTPPRSYRFSVASRSPCRPVRRRLRSAIGPAHPPLRAGTTKPGRPSLASLRLPAATGPHQLPCRSAGWRPTATTAARHAKTACIVALAFAACSVLAFRALPIVSARVGEPSLTPRPLAAARAALLTLCGGLPANPDSHAGVKEHLGA